MSENLLDVPRAESRAHRALRFAESCLELAKDVIAAVEAVQASQTVASWDKVLDACEDLDADLHVLFNIAHEERGDKEAR